MEKTLQIKNLLTILKDDREKIVELEKYDIRDIIKIGLKNGLFESLIILFQPISINGEMKIYFDPFSTDILEQLNHTYETEQQAINEAKEEYQNKEKRNSELSLEDREWCFDSRTYEEILSSKIVFPKQLKDAFIKQLFTIDFDKINKIKIKNSHARQISGWGHPIQTVEDVIFYSEPACLQTCIDLFKKNIKTTMNDTEGVLEDTPISSGVCKIWIDYRFLSEENKSVVAELIASGNASRFMDGTTDTVSIFVPCNSEQTVGEVSYQLQLIASKLKEQDILYGRGTLEETYQSYVPLITRFPFYAEGCFDNGVTVEGVLKLGQKLGCDLFYDEEEGLIWNSIELYERHKKYLSTKVPRKLEKNK